MQTITVGELKARFSEVLQRVIGGEQIVISFGKNRRRVAVLAPYNHLSRRPPRKLGLLKERGKCFFHEDFKLTDEELLVS